MSANPVPEAVAQRSHANPFGGSFALRKFRSGSHPGDGGNVFGAGPARVLVRSPVSDAGDGDT